MKKITKEQVINFLDRRKHPADKNLRWLAIIPIILMIIGLFTPFLGVDASLSLKDNSNSANSQQLIRPETSVVEFSINDFISHKPLREFEIWGQPIGDISILGINVYDTVMTPLPSFEALYQASDFLDSGALSFLTSADFQNFCYQNLGDLGANIVALANVISDIATKTGDALAQLTTILSRINATSVEIRNTIAQVEGYINTADNIVILLFILILIAIILFLISFKKARFLPAILLTIFSVIFLAIGIGALIGNSIIAGAIASSMQELSATIQAFIGNIFPGIVPVLSNIFGVDKMQFVPEIVIYCGVGWWFITIALVVLTVLAYIVPVFKKKRLIKEGVIAEKIADTVVEAPVQPTTTKTTATKTSTKATPKQPTAKKDTKKGTTKKSTDKKSTKKS